MYYVYLNLLIQNNLIMKNLFFLLLFLPLANFSQNSKESDDQIRLKEINNFTLKEYLLNSNTQPLEEVAANDFILVNILGGMENKEEVMKGVRNIKISDFKIIYDSVVVHDKVGILVGDLQMDGTIMENPVPKNIRCVSTFVKHEDDWKLQSRTMTVIQTPEKK